MDPRKVTIASLKGSSKLHYDAAVPGSTCMNGVYCSIYLRQVGYGDVAAFGLPRVLDDPSSSCLGIYWPNPGVNSSPAGRDMLTAKLDFLRLSNIKRTKGSSSSWQGFHHGLLPSSRDRFDLPGLHQIEVANG